MSSVLFHALVLWRVLIWCSGAPVLNEREAIELIDRLWDEMEIEAAGLTKKYGLA